MSTNMNSRSKLLGQALIGGDKAVAAVTSAPVAVQDKSVSLVWSFAWALSTRIDGQISVGLEGSHDGRSWSAALLPKQTVSLFSDTPEGPTDSLAGTAICDYAWLRVRVEWLGDAPGGALVNHVSVVWGHL